MTWSLYEDEKELKPLVFSNGKTQADIVREVIGSIKEGYKIVFIKGMCGSGKSVLALNLARHFGKTSIVVPIKSLQKQYIEDYSGKKYVLRNGKKLKICSIVGRQNFKCRFLEENKQNLNIKPKETNASLTEIFEPVRSIMLNKKDNSCDNEYIPCKVDIKEKNLSIIKQYIKQNSDVDITDFDSIKDIGRITIAPVCPYWSPISPIEIRKFKDSNKIAYIGLNNKIFFIHQRKPGCQYYEQYKNYSEADVIIFNSLKYKIESLMDRKPLTELEIIDECDEFLDSFAVEEQINLNKLLYSLNLVLLRNDKTRDLINNITDLANAIKISTKYNGQEFFELKNTLIEELLLAVLNNSDLIDLIELDEHNYIHHLQEVAMTFSNFLDETFFSMEKNENNLMINFVTTNLEKRFKELLDKNKVFIMMSGTIHSENVLRNIFGIDKFKIIEAEIKHQGELIKCSYGYEKDCSYASFQRGAITREEYLRALSKSIASAKKPVLIHVNSFSDLPTESEKTKYTLENLPTQEELIRTQKEDPLGQRVTDFKNKKQDILFTTKCSRGIDFPGDICNSIVITKFPYPNISGVFWKILRKTKPAHFMSFYIDKSKRELLQRIYRGLRSKDDKVYLLSPDARVLEFEFN